MQGSKTCTGCGLQKANADFALNKTTKSGLSSRCRACESERGKKRYAEKREFLKKQAADYRAANPERRLEIERSSRAKNKDAYRPVKNARQSIRNRLIQGKKFSLRPKELHVIYQMPCSTCGATDRITIDHVIPLARGGNHSIGNLMPLCLTCNISKGKKTLTEWKRSKMMIGVE